LASAAPPLSSPLGTASFLGPEAPLSGHSGHSRNSAGVTLPVAHACCWSASRNSSAARNSILQSDQQHRNSRQAFGTLTKLSCYAAGRQSIGAYLVALLHCCLSSCQLRCGGCRACHSVHFRCAPEHRACETIYGSH
jgi:hypothetical protein